MHAALPRMFLFASAGYNRTAGGVAYVGVFGRTDQTYQPAFIFSKNLGPDYAKYLWEACECLVLFLVALLYAAPVGC